jgi:quercetin dioxygenase-like cupin family protein
MIAMKVIARNKEIKQIQRGGKEVGGVIIQGRSLLKLMMTGKHIQLKELHLKKGFYHPNHNHPGEESIGYVIKGHLKMAIADQDYDLRDGDSWYHPDGVFHWTRAIEDTYAVEVHSPPRPEEHFYG